MRIFLCGGGDGDQTKDACRRLNDVVDHTKPILYLPFAMENADYDSCHEWVRGELRCVDVSDIEMVKSAEELDGTNVENYSAIFIGGGNTYKLLNDLKASGSFEKIKAYIEQDGIVFGGSAGAIIFGYDIESCAAMDQNKVGLKDTKGFDVLRGYSVFAHYTNGSSRLTEQENRERTERYTEKLLRYSQERGPVIAMPEEDTLFLNGDHFEMIGSRPYYCFEEGKRREMIP